MSRDIALSEDKRKSRRFNWPSVLWVAAIHAGALFAPFTFTWSGLVVCVALYVLTGLGITLGYHRLLTHRGFETPRIVEYLLALLGVLANQGGPLKWVAAHRKHHAFADRDGDPHSPGKGFWWAHMLWWMHYDPTLDDPIVGRRNVKDLAENPVYRALDRWQLVPPLVLAGLLFSVGELWRGAGLSWLVWGMFVRTTLVLHATWLVNSAAHVWGYRNFQTRDSSTNLWWVALLSLGEGWHNNHHAFQRSARHGLRWWELDVTYLVIWLLGVVGLARQIHVAPKPVASEPALPRQWRVVFAGKRWHRGHSAFDCAGVAR
jgi:stearoyl-CoA desaturase (delta-9 desaturase)